MASLFLPTGVVVIMQVSIFVHKMHAQELLEQKSLITIMANASCIQWNSKKEIRINGSLFDVKYFYINDQGQYIFTGLFDYQEMHLMGKLNRLEKESSKQQNVLLIKFFSFQSVVHNNCIEINVCAHSQLQPFRHSCSSMLEKGFISLFSPPPQNISS